MDFDESSDEEEPVPRYSKILKEEEYEDEDGPQGWDGSGLENNFESHQVDVIPWDPREPSFFFPIN
jgi:hypothetical protein